MQVLDRWTPNGEIPLWIVDMAANAGGFMGVAIESGVGICMLLPGWGPRIGSLLAVALHIFIGLNPTPNNAAVFGAKIMPRFFFAAPLGCAQSFKEFFSKETSKASSQHDLASHKGTMVAVLIMAFATFIGIENGNGELGPNVRYDWFVPWNALQMIFLVRGVWLDTNSVSRNSSSSIFSLSRWCCAFKKPHHLLLLALSMFYGFGTIILGVQQMGTAAGPFANLRIHGGSNHYLLPTGLLQQWSVGPYAGGIARVDDTNSSFLRKLYPHEISHNFSPRARSMMQAAGHTGREWMPLFSRTAGPYLPFSDFGRVPHVPYTVPALELRRLLLEARKQNEPFFLYYSKFNDSAVLDSVKSKARLDNQVRFSMDAQGAVSCLRQTGDASEPCALEELALLPEPSWWALKFHIGYPIPLPDDSPGPEVVCAT
jgi:hypothetical protein